MAVPKKKTTRSARNQRRSHHALSPKAINTCPQCQEPTLPHHVCASCGAYRGKPVLEIKDKNDKSTRRSEKKKDKKDNKSSN
ncbi:50S ribosomal protein L32 [Patescibacteria group bacterium]|nr:50S ribosomal protein L32 [Patescibacteria group bacterium]